MKLQWQVKGYNNDQQTDFDLSFKSIGDKMGSPGTGLSAAIQATQDTVDDLLAPVARDGAKLVVVGVRLFLREK